MLDMDSLLGSRIRKIVVFRALKIGDMLCSIPAFRMLRNNYPGVHITLVGLPWAQEFASRFPHYIDDFVEFPGYIGLPEQKFDAKRFLAFVGMIRSKKYDLAIQMQGDGTFTNSLVELFKAGMSAGFFVRGSFLPNDKTFFPYPDTLHEIDRQIELLKRLGAKPYGRFLEYPINNFEKRNAKKLLLQQGVGKEYIVMNPGASEARKRISPGVFIAVGRTLIHRGFDVVLTGVEAEYKVVSYIAMSLGEKAVNVCGKTTLGEAGAIIDGASLVITSDTGISHMACARKTPSIVIFTGFSDPRRWAPINRLLHKPITAHSVNEKVTAKMILKEAYKLIGRSERRAYAH